jgi:hypothetical protein
MESSKRQPFHIMTAILTRAPLPTSYDDSTPWTAFKFYWGVLCHTLALWLHQRQHSGEKPSLLDLARGLTNYHACPLCGKRNHLSVAHEKLHAFHITCGNVTMHRLWAIKKQREAVELEEAMKQRIAGRLTANMQLQTASLEQQIAGGAFDQYFK